MKNGMRSPHPVSSCGAEENRTLYLLTASQTLSQMSYGPGICQQSPQREGAAYFKLSSLSRDFFPLDLSLGLGCFLGLGDGAESADLTFRAVFLSALGFALDPRFSGEGAALGPGEAWVVGRSCAGAAVATEAAGAPSAGSVGAGAGAR